jgi:hypothetical protein
VVCEVFEKFSFSDVPDKLSKKKKKKGRKNRKKREKLPRRNKKYIDVSQILKKKKCLN